MQTVLILLTAQGVLGAFDSFWNHEWLERLPARPSAYREMKLHAVREFIYGVLFLAFGWTVATGAFAVALLALVLIEIVVTLWDFVVEDQTRALPAQERVTHTLLAINYGVVLAYLIPILIDWAQRPTVLAFVQYGAWSYIMTAFGVGVFLWGMRSALAARVLRDLQTPHHVRHPIKAGCIDHPRDVLVTGGTGFIGTALVRRLVALGQRVHVLSRDPAKAADLFGPHATAYGRLADIPSSQNIDTVVNLAGAPIAGGLWTRRRKAVLVNSRIGTTRDLVAFFAGRQRKPDTLISASAIGYYGARGDKMLAESDTPTREFMSTLCQRWEAEATQAKALGTRVVLLRTGLVLGRDGGFLAGLLPAFRLCLGGFFGNGAHWMSWIHRDDLVDLIVLAMDDPRIEGPLNATAPAPVTNRNFTVALGLALGRPAPWRIPAWPLRLALGEMADLFLTGQRVIPEKALVYGFRFRFPTLHLALSDLLPRRTEPKTLAQDATEVKL